MGRKSYQRSRWVIGLLLTVLAVGLYITQTIAGDSLVILNHVPLITAHRGNSAAAPENTIPAIERAIAANADYIEIDVRRTADGVIVLMHDNDLSRTTGAVGMVEESSYDELKELDAGVWFGEEFRDTKIPTLEEVLSFCQGKISINIEIKASKRQEGMVAQIIGLIQAYQMEEQCLITSFDYPYIQECKQFDAKIRAGIILNHADEWTQYPDVDLYSVKHDAVTKEIVEQIHQREKEIHVWTVDRDDRIRELQIMGVDNIITNKPEILQTSLRCSNIKLANTKRNGEWLIWRKSVNQLPV